MTWSAELSLTRGYLGMAIREPASSPSIPYEFGGIYMVTLVVTDNDSDRSIPTTTSAKIAFLNGDSGNDGLPDNMEDANGGRHRRPAGDRFN